MSHEDHRFSEEESIHNARSSISINETTSPSLISNVLMGVVISKTEGLTRTTLRIRVGEHTDLHVRWHAPLPRRGTANIGHRVCVTIPEEAVHLEAREGEARRCDDVLSRGGGIDAHLLACIGIIGDHAGHLAGRDGENVPRR